MQTGLPPRATVTTEGPATTVAPLSPLQPLQQAASPLAAIAVLMSATVLALGATFCRRIREVTSSLGMGVDTEESRALQNVRSWAMATTAGNQMTARETVDTILSKIANTDAGSDLGPEEKEAVDAMIEGLEKDYLSNPLRPLDDPTIFDNYEVSYVSSGGKQEGNPAGGRWRGALGKYIFRTTGLYQNLLKDNLVVNIVGFRFLSLLQGLVVLKGTFAAIDRPDFVRATFERPRLCLKFLGLKAAFDIGPTSAVELDCAYLDDRIRLGRGSRGSRFVFERTQDEAATAWEEVVAMQTTSTANVLFFLLIVLGVIFSLCKSNLIVGGLSAVLFALYALIFRSGGIIEADAIDKDKPKTEATA